LYIDESSPQRELKYAIRDTAITIENMLLEADAQILARVGLVFLFSQKYSS